MRNTDYAEKRGRFITSPGSKIHKLYSPELQEDGQLVLKCIGTEDTDEIIASYYESTTLEAILARFANGDMDALNRYEPLYVDVTQMPKTLAEAQQKVINSKNAFDALPVEIKSQFENNYNLWLATAGSEEWYGKMDPVFSHFETKKSEAAATELSEDSGASIKE